MGTKKQNEKAVKAVKAVNEKSATKADVKADIITEKDVIIRPIKNSIESAENVHLDGFKKPTTEIPNNIVFQAQKVKELINIYNTKADAKTIALYVTIDAKGNLKAYTDKALTTTYDTKNDNGYITYDITYKTINTYVTICLTTKGACVEPRKKQNRRQYMMFTDSKKASLTDDMCSGFNARLKAFLKSKGIIK